MPTEPSFTVVTRGIGKPDYSSEISLGRIRPGLTLRYSESLKIFGLTFSPIVSPYPFIKTPLPASGTHTAAVNLTIMTDAAATFQVNRLVGMIILNVTDGSSGTITANTINTVTVVALAGGTTNQWNTNDVYAIIAHFVDWETGLDFPFTIPVGYLYNAVEIRHSFTQDFTVRVFFDTLFVSHLVTKAAGIADVWAEVSPLSSSIFDPTAAAPHIYDIQIENLGGAGMEGSISIFATLQAVGTAPLRKETKTVKCKFCGHEWEVPQETTSVDCPSCGQLNFYVTLAHIREF